MSCLRLRRLRGSRRPARGMPPELALPLGRPTTESRRARWARILSLDGRRACQPAGRPTVERLGFASLQWTERAVEKEPISAAADCFMRFFAKLQQAGPSWRSLFQFQQRGEDRFALPKRVQLPASRLGVAQGTPPERLAGRQALARPASERHIFQQPLVSAGD